MPIEIQVWRIEEGERLAKLQGGTLELESKLEDWLAKDISLASPDWMVIGRQVPTAYGHRIDLLAVDSNGDTVVLELKKEMTPRDAVAQVLDYGAWVSRLSEEDLDHIYRDYTQKVRSEGSEESLGKAFCQHFKVENPPETWNANHHLVIVAPELDPPTERIVTYLSEVHGVTINAVFFRVLKDNESQFLTRAWFIEPDEMEEAGGERKLKGPWNGEVYVNFGHDDVQNWEDARRYGFVSAYGGKRYRKAMERLEPGQRIWVKVPGKGFVGVGEVVARAVPVEEFHVTLDGEEQRLLDLELKGERTTEPIPDPDEALYLAGVRWIRTFELGKAVAEEGMFGNQNVVSFPKDPRWNRTVERLKQIFGVK
ncbi:MAG: endonuclease NucS domain-containing protein [Acidobacteriota bacterium]